MPVKRENELKAELFDRVRTRMVGYVLQAFQQVRDSGTPDACLTGHGCDSWWECKHGTPDFESKGVQELTMLRLDAAGGRARYVIWHEERGIKRTLIIRPNHLRDLQPDAWCTGFDHGFVVDYMRRLHE